MSYIISTCSTDGQQNHKTQQDGTGENDNQKELSMCFDLMPGGWKKRLFQIILKWHSVSNSVWVSNSMLNFLSVDWIENNMWFSAAYEVYRVDVSCEKSSSDQNSKYWLHLEYA